MNAAGKLILKSPMQLIILTLREKCPNTELFLVHIFPHSDWKVSLRIQSECGKIRTRNNSVFGHFSRSVGFLYSMTNNTLKRTSNLQSNHMYYAFYFFEINIKKSKVSFVNNLYQIFTRVSFLMFWRFQKYLSKIWHKPR